jgi:hypothetical protein
VLIEAVLFDPPLPAGTVTDGVRVDVDPQQWTDVRARAHAQEIVCNQAVAEVQVTLEPCPQPPAPAG